MDIGNDIMAAIALAVFVASFIAMAAASEAWRPSREFSDVLKKGFVVFPAAVVITAFVCYAIYSWVT